ncbi:helix-turn-helix domain-containing protein, partial [Lacticaseibacillus paracasei]
MTLFERIQKVSREHAMSLRELNEKAGLGTNAIYRWKKTKPSADKLQAVADVL